MDICFNLVLALTSRCIYFSDLPYITKNFPDYSSCYSQKPCCSTGVWGPGDIDFSGDLITNVGPQAELHTYWIDLHFCKIPECFVCTFEFEKCSSSELFFKNHTLSEPPISFSSFVFLTSDNDPPIFPVSQAENVSHICHRHCSCFSHLTHQQSPAIIHLQHLLTLASPFSSHVLTLCLQSSKLLLDFRGVSIRFCLAFTQISWKLFSHNNLHTDVYRIIIQNY